MSTIEKLLKSGFVKVYEEKDSAIYVRESDRKKIIYDGKIDRIYNYFTKKWTNQ